MENSKINQQKDKKKCIIIFSGYNQRAVIAFLRTLESNNLDYVIISKSLNDDIFLTKYKDKILAIRTSLALDLNDILSCIKQVKEKCGLKEFVIAPSTEALNRFLLEKKEHFINIGCEIPLVNKELYETISDKYNFGKICLKNGIIIPKEFEFTEKYSLPIVAKPKRYFSSITNDILSPIIIKDLHEKKVFLENYNQDDFYYQEYIEGRDYYLLYYFHRNGNVYKFSQENLIQQPGGKSMVAAISSNFHNTNESANYEKLFKSLKFYGLVMIEVKQKENKNYMIEANPRFWGPSQLFVDARMNFFEVFLHDYGLIGLLPKFKQTEKVTRYFWFGGIVNTIKRNLNLDFYNMGEADLIDFIHNWVKVDVYKRYDTRNIFKKEFING